MQNYKEYFKGKKVTVMGLGLLGRGVGDAAFLAECGADLIVTDLKTKEQLQASLNKLGKFKNIKFTLGEHKLEDFKDRDFILKAAGVPLDSIYIAEARKNNIPIEMSASLFAKLSGVPVIGVTGTRGKSTVTYMIEHILKTAGKKVLLGGNVRGVSTLDLLRKVKGADYAVFELDSWQLQGFGEEKISPKVSVFTNLQPDHMNYYKNDLEAYFTDKANIYKYQETSDAIICGEEIAKKIGQTIGQKVVAGKKDVPTGWKIKIIGEHNLANTAYAIKAAEALNIPVVKIKKAVESFKGVEGRLQLLKIYKGIKIYNDNNATTLNATMAGIEAAKNIGSDKKLILISGGTDKIKDVDLQPLVTLINKYCKAAMFLNGTGTERLLTNYKLEVVHEASNNLKEIVKKAISLAKKGDTILFSPAFASFGLFTNEYERNDQFVKLIKALK